MEPKQPNTAFNLMVGDNLRAIRRERGYSQRDLADAAGVGMSLVSRWENGCGMTFSNAIRVCDALGVSVEDLRAEPRMA